MCSPLYLLVQRRHLLLDEVGVPWAADSTSGTISLSDLQRSCVTRDFLLESKDVSFLDKLVRGLFARAVPHGARTAKVFSIVGVGRPSSRLLPARHSDRGEIPCALTLNLFDVDKGTTIRVPCANISNSRPLVDDLSTLTRARHARKGNAFKEDLERSWRRIRRIVKDRRDGRHCSVQGHPWGSKHAQHEVWVLLRSWRVQPTSDETLRTAGAAAPDSSSLTPAMDGDPSDPAYFRISLAPPARAGDLFGWGPSRQREKWRGPFSFLLQHHQRSKGVEATLRPPRLRASPYDEEQPDLTAWRVLRRYAHEDIPLAIVRACTLLRVDLVGRSTEASPARVWDPRTDARTDVAASGGGGGAASAAAPAFQLPSVPSRALDSPVQLYVIDADALLRAGWPPRSGEALPLGTCPVLQRNLRNPDDIFGPEAAVRSDTFPEGLAWVEEAWWDELLPSAAVSHTKPWGDRFESVTPPTATAPGADEPYTTRGGPRASATAEGTRPRPADRSTASQPPSICGVAFAPSMLRALASLDEATSASLRALLCPPRRSNWVRLYHGTKPSLARKVQAHGFLRPVCRNLPACRGDIPGRRCECQMEGFGVYFGDRVKARKFAVRRAERIPDEDITAGSIITVDVDMGRCKRAPQTPCPCGCGQSYVDHPGAWYSVEGFDSLYLSDRSMPASATAECCVADPGRIRVVGVESVPVEASEPLPSPANDISERH